MSSSLSTNADVNAADGSELTPLHQAVLRQDARMVTLLLALGAKNEDNQRIHPHSMVLCERTRVSHGMCMLLKLLSLHQVAGSPLHLACTHLLVEVVDAFLQHGSVDINVTDRRGRTPLMAALNCLNPSKEFVEHLLANGADARWTVPTTGMDVLSTLLRVPATKETVGIMEMLIDLLGNPLEHRSDLIDVRFLHSRHIDHNTNHILYLCRPRYGQYVAGTPVVGFATRRWRW
jgi:hypothetical protein